MQTILGSGGVIGQELARELPKYTKRIRLVARNPVKVNETDQLFAADLTKREEVINAIEGSEVVYLTIGLPYNTKVWQRTWPIIMDYVLEGCKIHNAKLVFFDNVYMYDPNSIGEMTEDNPVNPKSKKGKVRAEIAKKVLDSVERGEVAALIARSADFYGPGKLKVSMLTQTVLNPLSQGKKASCLGSVDKIHSFTYTPDAGKAVAILGNTSDAYGVVWHLPTSGEKWTTRQFIEYSAKRLGMPPKYQVAGKFMVGAIGLFVPIMKEMKEMLYQYDQDYHFVSMKFQERFNFQPTLYADGIDQIISSDYSS